MIKLLRFLLPMVILAASFAVAFVLINTGPKAERRKPPPVLPLVEITVAEPTSYQVRVHSRGTVSPRTESTLIPEVAGRVIEVSSNFRQGGFFESGETLMRIDPRDYESAVTVALSELARARVELNEEQARARQAVVDWQRLGVDGEPSDLVLRKPQLARAEASVAAAEARLAQARADLERTQIVAPYAGRVLAKQVDVGQYVAPGNVLASIYAVDYVEIRLPLSNEQLEFIELPELYRGETPTAADRPRVRVRARIGQRDYEWHGEIVRTEGAIDTRSRQLFVVAQIDDPYARRDHRPPLKVGQFVEAVIPGRRLDGVFALPRSALRAGDALLLVDDDDKLQRRAVRVAWQDDNEVVIGDGLSAGERVALTNLPYATSGTLVRVKEAAAPAGDARLAAGRNEDRAQPPAAPEKALQ